MAIGPARPPDLADELHAFTRDERIDGAVLAIGRVGQAPRLIVVGDAAPGRRLRADDRFRLASLSKPITAAATLALVRGGRLRLEDSVPEAGPNITVRHLLQHSGGWDRAQTFDPIAEPRLLHRLRMTHTRDCTAIADRMAPVQFAPGTRHAYSNIGYCRLGQAIVRVAGMPYAAFATRAVLAPRGVRLSYGMRPSVAHDPAWPRWADPVLGPGGGWSGSAADYWRFAAGPIDPLVRDRPAYADRDADSYYGLGWRVWRSGELSHFGAIAGVFTLVVRDGERVAVLLCNGRPRADEAAVRHWIAVLRARWH